MLRFNVPFILASESPRRRRLLEQLGLTFEVRAHGVEEIHPPDASPEDIVLDLSLRKAEPVADAEPGALTLGADTVVVLDGEVLGKPADAAHARLMLQRLSGRTHEVFTGIAIVHAGSDRCVTAHEATAVTFAEMSEEEIDRYVATGSPIDKAGAYGIQDDCGALFVSRIDGDYYNVVGLPLHRFYRMVRYAFPDLMT